MSGSLLVIDRGPASGKPGASSVDVVSSLISPLAPCATCGTGVRQATLPPHPSPSSVHHSLYLSLFPLSPSLLPSLYSSAVGALALSAALLPAAAALQQPSAQSDLFSLLVHPCCAIA